MSKFCARVQIVCVANILAFCCYGAAIGQDAVAQEPFPSRHLMFSADGKLLACSYGEVKTRGLLRIWDWKNDTVRLERQEDAGICSVAFSPNGKSVAIGMFGAVGRCIDLTNGKVQAEFKGHTNHFRTVAYVSDDLLASGSYDRTIRLWNATNGQELSILGQHASELRSIAISPDGRYLASGATSPDCRLFDLGSMREVAVFEDSSFICPQVRFSSTGKYLVAASWDHKVRIRETASQKVRASISLDAIYGISLAPDDSVLLGFSDSPLISAVEVRLDGPTDDEKAELMRLAKLWRDDDYAIREQASRDVAALGVAVVPLLKSLASMKNAEIKIRAREARRRLMQDSSRKIDVGHKGNLRALQFSPDNVHVATGDTKGVVKIWNFNTQEVVKTFNSLPLVNSNAKEH